MDSPIAQFDHPAWFTAAGTLIAYAIVLLVLFAVLFVIPLVLFQVL